MSKRNAATSDNDNPERIKDVLGDITGHLRAAGVTCSEEELGRWFVKKVVSREPLSGLPDEIPADQGARIWRFIKWLYQEKE